MRFRPILEVVGPYLPDLTKKTANRYDALCPFHEDNTPSLSVYVDTDTKKGRFVCWACGERGDAIDFLKEHLGISYSEAKRMATEEVDLLTGLEDKLKNVTQYAASPINLSTCSAVLAGYAELMPPEQWNAYAIRFWSYAFAKNHRLAYAVLTEMEVDYEFSRL